MKLAPRPIIFQKRNVPLFVVPVLCALACVLIYAIPGKEPLFRDSRILAVAVLEDPSGDLTIEDVTARPNHFKQQQTPQILKGHTRSTFWIRCTLGVPTQGDATDYLEIASANLDEIKAYFGTREIRAGIREPHWGDTIHSFSWFFPISPIVDRRELVYVQVRSSDVIKLPLSVVTDEEMMLKTQRMIGFFGALFGMLAAIVLVNLFSFFVLRERYFLLNAISLLFFMIYELLQQGFPLGILYRLPFFASNAILWIAFGAFGISIFLFSRRVLRFERRIPLVYAVTVIFMSLFVGETCLGIFGSVYMANSVLAPLMCASSGLMLGATYYLYAKGHQTSRYFLYAWAILFTMSLIKGFQVTAKSQFWLSGVSMVNSIVFALFFTFSIFDLIRLEIAEKDRLKERERYYRALSNIDALTGLYNRRYLGEIVAQMEKDNEMPPISTLIMIDLDNFKNVNDTYGHLIGDIILTKMSSTIKKHIRKSDIACRYGGDEFLVFLPGAQLEIAQSIAEDIRSDIAGSVNYSEKGEEILGSVSLGVTESRVEETFDGMFLRADAALYQAKKLGKNQIAFL